MNNLFQFLDGVSSPSNSIIIATTNYYDKLDPALIRDGRFDIKEEITEFDYDNAVELCKIFKLSDDKTRAILDNEQLPINPAYLQNKILKNL